MNHELTFAKCPTHGVQHPRVVPCPKCVAINPVNWQDQSEECFVGRHNKCTGWYNNLFNFLIKCKCHKCPCQTRSWRRKRIQQHA